MTFRSALLIAFASFLPALAQTPERLGAVAFATSCTTSQQAAINRGIALVHDFWYEESQRQFEQILKADPACAIAHWGIAMSLYHQIWNRPGDAVMTQGWSELQKATGAATQREKEYIAALAVFYKPGPLKYQQRVDLYSAAMRDLYAHYPEDIDAAAFFALSLLADVAPDDTSLSKARQALALLTPLFEKYPDHPGLAHYIIHACDNPSMAQQGLHAAERYGVIASSGAHAAHMGGHIFARLGMWPEDIRANLAAVSAAERAAENNRGGGFDQLHPDDFLLYAYLQSGQDAAAKALLDNTAALLKHMASMPGMIGDGMETMLAGYSTEFPVIYALERRDWKTAAAIPPVAGAPADVQILTYWGRAIADGHLKDGAAARADLAKYETLMEQVKKGPRAYLAEGAGPQIENGAVRAWAAYAQSDFPKALSMMRETADLQDKVGQGEVDIPVREMLADMLLELKRPQDALIEYERSLRLSPNRFNGLYNAGMAAEAAGDGTKARQYYTTLLKVTDNGIHTTRFETAHAKAFLANGAAEAKN
ncbi:MAG TPA: tetratricopeptide repeat protein [Bryobacteraceae bacterium]|nr:tetratricopeptide repeat protein [Bryobacteraceae bacterium]